MPRGLLNCADDPTAASAYPQVVVEPLAPPASVVTASVLRSRARMRQAKVFAAVPPPGYWNVDEM